MSGRLPVNYPRIPGHEFGGTVLAVGSEVNGIEIGQRVCVNPVLACGLCRYCSSGKSRYCVSTRFLGLDLDGACAEIVAVPAQAVFSVPDSVPMTVCAFAEPVAASLGVLNSGIVPADSGVIIGDNRIGRLTQRVLQAHGFDRVEVQTAADADRLPDDEFDFAIETEATPEVLLHLLRVIRPQGRMILKSRPAQSVPVDFRKLLPKEPLLCPVNYGPFDSAVQLLVDGRVQVEDLVGNCWPLSRYDDAIEDAHSQEHKKTFLLPSRE